jgi:hypothetical protein
MDDRHDRVGADEPSFNRADPFTHETETDDIQREEEKDKNNGLRREPYGPTLP